MERNPIGIVAELNGSARTCSIDRQFLEALGVRVHFINDQPRQIVHPIVPEGENLELCRRELESSRAKDPSFILGYVPDNDGDRGNIVYYDERAKGARILGAQELFALVACIELTLSKKPSVKQAIVVNGPTSLMIDAIAQRLEVAVFRAEVGEANVVRLAEQIRSRGYSVRLLGEGSNGGNITHPSKVRDPLNTLVSLIKLLSSETRFKAITALDGPPSIARALDALPRRTITGGFSAEAVMRIRSTDHGALKEAYERQFLASYLGRIDELKQRFGICGWREEQTEGTVKREGMGAAFRSGPMRGGLKIIFSDCKGVDTDFIWMRGSGTEPVFRIMADAAGRDQARHDYLLAWQRSLVEAADAYVCSRT
jgi:phosphomannomutase